MHHDADGEDLATVEAIFETEDGGELIVRREITSQGRSWYNQSS